ncbi:MAG: glycosyl hydrolase 115 family protein [Prevotella sp.]|nr:glycosyl hydrolase 115 family protein [Prevotella sp.]
MKKTFHLLISLLIAGFAVDAQASEQFVNFNNQGWCLNEGGRVAVFVDTADKGVQRAANDLCTDINKVCGAQSAITGQLDEAQIVITIDPKMKAREKYVIDIQNRRVSITGSDKRGAIYGIYELSRQMGVSPWYYWADVPVEKHDRVFLVNGSYTDGEPAVRYRGLFLNDEAPCLTSWVKNTFGTNYGGHDFYEKVFELILRLKGNFLWPAMWGWAFYADDPLNSPTADEMGVIIGTSHHEPMARNHQEWARHRREYGAWNYSTNKEVLDRFFREGIERIKNTEDIVTIGMRGDGDEAMSEEADTKLLLDIVNNQRRIIKEVTGRPAKETPQVWALYKEVLDYYDKGMRVPDDVTILLCDDNWGNVRRVPTAKERKRPGGWGLYYHVDYVGAPRNSKWLNVTPIQNMWEQLTLSLEYGIDRLWVLNVGDLKPMEYPIQLFMDMAWKGEETIPDHTLAFCQATFGNDQADEAARLLNLCCKYNGRITAEMLDHRTYNLASGEWQQVVADYDRLEMEALRQFATLKPEYHDAYQQIILFPIQAMANIYHMYYAQAMNLKCYDEGNPDANLWADRVVETFRRDSLLCAAYNHDFANGKWNGMMTQKHIGYRSWNDDFGPRDIMPRVKRLDAPAEGNNIFTENNGMVAIEAEHYYSKTDAANAQWTIIPFMGRTLSGITLRPYVQNVAGASLNYRFNTSSDITKVVVVVKSTLDFLNQGGLRFRVTLDDQQPQTINFNANLNENPQNIYSVYYPTVARRVVESTVNVTAAPGTHTLRIEPLDPAIVFEKIIIDCGGYQPSYLHGQESPRSVR